MSTTVDQRVVEMRFDNAQFERGAKESLSTLDKLKEKLQFKGAEKGFENISAASRKVDFDEMSGALDTIQMKFSAMDVIAVTALTHITEKLISTGEQMVKSLSVDQITSGWSKYVEKTGNVQTIMNATGKSVDQVNGYLAKLMWYSDETSFSFNEMTSALSSATAAGGKIDKMIPMIMGIANATADAGKNGYAFQSTIRNLMQSYSAGYLQLMDWKSLNLMGTGTKALKQELISTAEELGTIQKDEVTISNFETTLSKKWATREVMEKTFGKYAQMMTDAYELTQQNKGMTTSEALEQLSGKYGEIAERSALAAQQAKSFGEAIDSTKDAVSSKWMAIFETIVGGYDEAVKTWTELANRLYDIFAAPLDDLEDRLNGALDSGYVQLQKLFGDDSDIYTGMLEKTALATGAVTQQAIDDAGSFAEALKQGSVNAEDLHAAVKKTVKDADEMLAMTDSQLKAKGFDRSELEEIRNRFAQINEEITNGGINLGEYAKKMGQMSGREHLLQSIWNIWDAIGKVTTPVMQAFHEIFAPANSKQIYSFAEGLDNLTRKLIISDDAAEKIRETFKGLFSVAKFGVNLVGRAAKIIAELLISASPLIGGILNAASAFGKCLSELTHAIEGSNSFAIILKGLQRAVSSTGAVLNYFASILSRVADNTETIFAPLKRLGTWLSSFFDTTVPGIEKFGTVIWQALKTFWNGVKDTFNNADPEKFAEWISTGLTAGILATINGLLKGLKEVAENAGGIVGGIKQTIQSLGESVEVWQKSKKSETLLTIAKSVAIMAASLAIFAVIDPERMTSGIGGLTVVLSELVGAFLLIDRIGGKTKGVKLAAMASSMVAMSASVLILAGAVKSLSLISSEKFVSSLAALGVVMAELTAVTAILTKIGGRVTKGAVGIIAFAAAVRILVTSVKTLGQMSSDELIAGLASLGVLMTELASFMAAAKFGKLGIGKATGILILSVALKALQKAVASFGGMSWGEIVKGLTAAGVALTEFASFGFVAGFSKNLLSSAASVFILSSSMSVLSRVMSSMGNMSWEEIGKGLAAMGGGLAEFVIALNLAKGTLGAAAALTMMAIAVNALVPALKTLGNLSLKEVGMALLSIASAFAVVGIAAAILSPLTPVIVALSVAMSALAISIGLLLTPLSLLGGLNFQVLLVSLKSFAWLLVEFVAGIIKGIGEIAATLATSIAAVITAVCDGITQAIPSIANALTALVISVCQIIVNCAEPIGNALFVLATTLLKKGVELIKWIFWGDDGTGGLIGALGDALAFIPKKIAGFFSGRSYIGKDEGYDDGVELGNNLAQGEIDGMNSRASDVKDAGNQLGQAAVDGEREATKTRSPSRVMAENGQYLAEGLIEGIQNGTSGVGNGLIALSEKALGEFRDFWGIHSPSDLMEDQAQYMTEGLAQGWRDAQNQKKVLDAQKNLNDKMTEEAQNGAKDAVEIVQNILAGLLSTDEGESTPLETAQMSTKTKSSSSSKKKTVAETIAEEYEAKLKANKYLKDAADKEWALWEAGEGKDASDAEYLAKKGEALSREIENQTERVAIAKEEYDKLLEKAPEDDKTKEAYSSWLDEEKSLVTLQRERYESLYKEVLSRQSDRADTEDAEYDLWTAEKEKTADLYEKYGRNTENLAKKIEIQNEIVVTAETKYRELADALGEGSKEAQEAYREWLKQRTEQLNLENSLRKAQLQLYSDEIDRLELEEKTLTNRQNLLAKIYDDGSLADRQDDYAAAVKEYGEDSKEARKIAVQGTMSSIMSLGSAMSGMSYGLKKLAKAQSLYNRYVEEGTQNRDEAIEAYQEVQSLQSDIVGFAEDLATAFDMDETGKKMMMQLGNSLAKNWPKVQTGLKTVFDKLEKAAPALSEKLGNMIGLFGREGASETVTDGLAAVTSAMGGDLGTALTSMLNFALDMAGTDFGKTLSEFLGNEFVKYFPQVAGILSSMLGGGIDLAALGPALSAAVEGAGGLAALLPELLPLAGVIAAAGAALWAVFNWDTVSKWLSGAWKAICDFMNNLDTKLPELLKGLADTLWSILFWPIALPLKLLGGDLKKTADSAAETGTETLSTMLADLSEAEIAPTITPVVDLSDAEESAAWMQSAFALDDGSYSVAGTRTASLAGAVETRAQDERKRQADEAEKPDPADQNRDVVEAVNAMGERIDGVAKAVGNMKMVVNGKKFVGAIRNDMNTALAEVQRG